MHASAAPRWKVRWDMAPLLFRSGVKHFKKVGKMNNDGICMYLAMTATIGRYLKVFAVSKYSWGECGAQHNNMMPTSLGWQVCRAGRTWIWTWASWGKHVITVKQSYSPKHCLNVVKHYLVISCHACTWVGINILNTTPAKATWFSPSKQPLFLFPLTWVC